MNQTLNAVINYGNRNSSAEYTAMDITKSYGSACIVSIGSALSIRKGLSSYTKNMKGPKLQIFNSISSCIAISAAGFTNAYLMRQTELKKGVDIFHPENPDVAVGQSINAAQMAVTQTAISRAIFGIPILFPAFI